MVDEMLMPDILKVSDIYLERLKKKMETFSAIESFDYPLISKKDSARNSGKGEGESPTFQTANISGYARNSYELVLSFMNDFFLVINGQLHQYFVKSVVSLISHCGDVLSKIVDNRKQLTDRQYFNLMNDFRFFATLFTPTMRNQILQKLGKSFPDFEALIKRLEGNFEYSYMYNGGFMYTE